MKLPIPAFFATICMVYGLGVQAQTTLIVTAFPDVDQVVKAAIPAWKKLHPDVDIKLVAREFADHHTAMTIGLATGSSQADVMAVEWAFLGRFAEGGGLENLSKPPYNGDQYKAKFASYTIPLATNSAGELVAIPTDLGPGTLFYRDDILQKAHVREADLTKSWDSYLAAGKIIKEKTGVYLLAHARDMKDIVIRTNLKDGEGIYFDTNNKSLVESERFVKAFELAKAVREAKLDADINAWSNEWTESFKRGTVATQMMGAWLAGHLEHNFAPNTKGLWRAAQLPDQAFASWGGNFYAIPKSSKNKEMAWEFVKFMTLNKENQLAAFKAENAFPALLDAQNDSFFDQPIAFLGGEKARLLWREAVHHIQPTEVNKFDPVAEEIINTSLDKVLEGGKDIKTALADARALIERRSHRR